MYLQLVRLKLHLVLVIKQKQPTYSGYRAKNSKGTENSHLNHPPAHQLNDPPANQLTTCPTYPYSNRL